MNNEIEEDDGKDPLMSRLDFLFDVLDIDDVDCQQKVICEVVRNQEKLSPLSDLLISIFRSQILYPIRLKLVTLEQLATENFKPKVLDINTKIYCSEVFIS